LTTYVELIFSRLFASKNPVGIENFPALKFEIGNVNFNTFLMIHDFLLRGCSFVVSLPL
jgi:hypothetical protein